MTLNTRTAHVKKQSYNFDGVQLTNAKCQMAPFPYYHIENHELYNWNTKIDGILPKGPYPPCLRMADRALLAGYLEMKLLWYNGTALNLIMLFGPGYIMKKYVIDVKFAESCL